MGFVYFASLKKKVAFLRSEKSFHFSTLAFNKLC